jgi:hypothetical protein
MTELFTSGSVGGMASNGCLYPETITITGAHICRWEWIVLSRDRCSRQRLER